MVAVKQLVPHFPEGHGQIHVGPVWVFQTQGLLPERGQLALAVSLELHHLGRLINADAILEYRNHQLPQGVAVGRQIGLFPGFHRIKQQ